MKSILSQIGMNVIQQLGQQLGVPPGLINMAQNAFASATGQRGLSPQPLDQLVNGIAQQAGFSPRQTGELQRSVNDMNNEFLKMVQGSTGEGEGDLKSDPKAGGSFLMRLAIALGKIMDKKMNKMVELSGDISKQTSIATSGADKDEKSNASTKLGELNGQLSAVGQELNIISNALNTAIKSVGESQTTVARKS
jgi:hypothetical protein